MCRFQSYTEDIPVNRLLKRALVFARRMLTTFMKHHKQYEVLLMKINRLYHRFENISDYVEISEVKSITSNVLFRYYSIAIRVAKEILRRYDYSLSKISEEMKSTPPFWIDMSILTLIHSFSQAGLTFFSPEFTISNNVCNRKVSKSFLFVSFVNLI